MPQLLIVRHAIAEDRDVAARVGHNDAERPLTRKGIKRMRQIAIGIAQQISSPTSILCSPLRRARQTAELLARRLPDTEITIEERLAPDSSIEELLMCLEKQGIEGTGILVGHEPELSTLISMLLVGKTSASIQLKKGGAALLDFPQKVAAGQASLLWLMTPRQLRACAIIN